MANENYDYSDVESQLKKRAQEKGLAYDPSDLEDIKRNAGYDTGGIGVDQALGNAFKKYDERAASNGGGGGQQSNQAMQAWSAQPAPAPAAPAPDPRRDELYNTLLQRSKQSLDLTGDPTIAAQTTAYRANQDRATRDYISDTAEKAGPLANIQGERRMAAERNGQNTATFEAELRSRELTSRRDEIQQALQGLQGILSQDQQVGLQRELAAINQMLEQQRIDLSGKSLDQQWREALMQNQLGLGSLGLQAEDRASYWDAVRSGVIGG